MQSDADRRITRFVEKPKDEAVLERIEDGPRNCSRRIGSATDEELFQASMGIYVFNRDVLVECLDNDLVDFGKHIIPQSIKERQVSAYIFNGYWEDIGTIRAFYEANLDLTDLVPAVQFLRSVGADLHASAFLAGQQDQRRDLATGDHRRRLHHLRRAHGAMRHRRAQHHSKRRHDSEQHRHGRRLLRTQSSERGA